MQLLTLAALFAASSVSAQTTQTVSCPTDFSVTQVKVSGAIYSCNLAANIITPTPENAKKGAAYTEAGYKCFCTADLIEALKCGGQVYDLYLRGCVNVNVPGATNASAVVTTAAAVVTTTKSGAGLVVPAVAPVAAITMLM